MKKFDLEEVDGQTISNAILAYSKSHNGSKQFFRALESTIIKNSHKMSPQELSNTIYSYHKSENASVDPLLLDLRNVVVESIHKYKPVELCQVLLSYTESGMMDEEMIEVFQH